MAHHHNTTECDDVLQQLQHQHLFVRRKTRRSKESSSSSSSTLSTTLATTTCITTGSSPVRRMPVHYIHNRFSPRRTMRSPLAVVSLTILLLLCMSSTFTTNGGTLNFFVAALDNNNNNDAPTRHTKTKEKTRVAMGDLKLGDEDDVSAEDAAQQVLDRITGFKVSVEWQSVIVLAIQSTVIFSFFSVSYC